MFLSVIIRKLPMVFVVAFLAGVSGALCQKADRPDTGPAPDVLSKSQRDAIEKVIREYLLKNPEVIRDAMQEMQAREEKEKLERAAKNLRELGPDIYSDSDSPVLGNPKGDVTVVVFFDYNCGYCKKSLPELRSLTATDRMIRIIYKEFPILGPQSLVAAKAALAAVRQGRYEAINSAMFAADGAGEPMLKGVADQLKLNYARLLQDMADPKIGAEIERNMKLATDLDINGTPAYIIGEQIIPGAIDMTSLATLIAAERAKNAGPRSAPGAVPATKK